MTRRLLLTGASGRLGSHVVPELQSRDFELIAPGLAGMPARVDLASPGGSRAAVLASQPEIVVHLAGAVPGRGRRFEENESVTAELAAAAAEAGARLLVFISSAAVYGDRRTWPLVESEALEPSSDYGRSKAAAERALASSGVPAVVLRVFNVYGTGFDDSLVNRLVASTPDRPVELRGLGGFVRDYVSAADVARAVASAALVEPQDGFVAMNIGSGVPRSNRELLDELSQYCEVHWTDVGGPTTTSVADIGRAQRMIAFAPTASLDLGGLLPRSGSLDHG
ncbi:NAD-dependent epimerase/dehydratase family protein [Salinibacterium soli]|uniref:NAD(P)-dependent oxidoreductase n=1 Tax=Antiquaquibacter soli TaxID=3064523 RepID=A0ABT9BJC8_9MICO|nr:NAD(P)-dependent oxidoreductase [Protaetiibacter sp. WY-16]MDO7881120.1 NAD(P)-dependent oxidoreductase [Protaetiibacter sp. WY-16]